MKPASFEYARPRDLAEALDWLAEYGADARILAGGQSLIAMLNMRLASPRLLVDVSRLAGASDIRDEDSHIAIGCAVRQAELLDWPELGNKLPLLAKALPWVGHEQTRSRGTVCGSIAHADPSSELPLCLTLLGGEVVLQSNRRMRKISASEFFQGALQTARQDNEMITEVRFPVAEPGAGTAFNEMAIRHGDFAIIAVAAIANADSVTIAIGGAANRPVAACWPLPVAAELDELLNGFAWSLECEGDLHATAAYRRHLVRVLGRRTIEEAIACRS